MLGGAYHPPMACGCGPKGCSDFDDDREGVAEQDLARFGGDDISCPSCGVSVYHDATQCHKCGHAMTSDSTVPDKKWVPVVAGVIVAAFLAFVMLRVI